jgi:hypothetical protein
LKLLNLASAVLTCTAVDITLLLVGYLDIS